MKSKYNITNHIQEHGCKSFKAIQKRACRCVEDLRREHKSDEKDSKKKPKTEEIKKIFKYDPNDEPINLQDKIKEMLKLKTDEL